ncbi:MAG TPA: prephenate dehydrogenase/arogenate dehydrogenase family protein [Oceanipulchritudo sp.]|nr:prephenate dehydrogenase/arogenate dehydrogenase family protein [Oceanipulchritudo sp.]
MTILAPGLLGASLGMATRHFSLAKRVHVWARRAESRAACQSSTWCDQTFADPGESVRGSDLVVLCTPVDAIAGMVREISPNLRKGTLVTDVGSTKSRICRLAARSVPEGVCFVGSHPMAGSEKSGMVHATENLFRNRACLVTPLEETPPDPVDALVRFWRALGMEVTTLSPEHHDEIVANISHLPHLLASVLCLHLSRKPKAWQAYSGNGLRDTTRIAAGNSEIWRSIFEENREELLRAIDGFERELASLRAHLHNGEWAQVRHLLELGKTYREGLD